MPELPDICAYLEALEHRVESQTLQNVTLLSPFFLRSVLPPLDETFGRRVDGLRRLGKRIAIGLTTPRRRSQLATPWRSFILAGEGCWLQKLAPGSAPLSMSLKALTRSPSTIREAWKYSLLTLRHLQNGSGARIAH